MLYFSYTFDFVPELVKWVNRFISDEKVFDTLRFKVESDEKVIKGTSFVPKQQRIDLDDLINPELRKLNIPPLQYLHVFIWPPFSGGFYKGHFRDIHLDLYPHLKIQKQAAYNVPIVGFNDDCFFEWYTGKVKTEKILQQGQQDRNNVTFEWEDGPHLLDEIVQTKPYFVAINKPHRIRTGKDTRVMASLRFEEEMSVNDYYQKLITTPK